MTTAIRGGPLVKSLSRDQNGHRTYKVKFRIEGDSTPGSADGPTKVLLTPGLPVPGTVWNLDADVDLWAWCLPDCEIRQEIEGERCKFWTAEYTFTTKPIERSPVDPQQQDPFFEPMKLSGSFLKYTETGTFDRFGNRIATSAGEQIFGPENEWDQNRPTVRVEQNSAILGIRTFAPMIDTLNDRPLWGLPARSWKLDQVTWTEKFHKYSKYFNRILEFSAFIRYDASGALVSGWDRDIPDVGTLVLRGEWVNGAWTLTQVNGQNPVPGDPASLIRYQDVNGNICKVQLDGAGKPYAPEVETTAACSQCASAPSRWVLGGFPTSEGLGGGLSQYNGIELAHVSGCTWTYSTVDLVASLTYDSTDTRWELTVYGNDVGATWLFTKSPGQWSCLGGNVMSGDSGNVSAAPPTMTVWPAANNPGGNIHVEKYGESNFLLLGIPIGIGP